MGWHTPAKEIIETLALVAEGSRASSLSRVKGYKEETIRNWLQQAAEHLERVEDVLMQEYEIDRGQLDGLWSYRALVLRRAQASGTRTEKRRIEKSKERRGKKNRLTTRRGSIGVRQWSKQIRGSALDGALARPLAVASEEVFRTLKRTRGHPGKPPPTVSDGGGGMRKAMVQVWGEVPEYIPEYKGRGRPPEKKRPQDGWEYLQVINLQVIKERDESDRVTETRKEVVFGEEEEILELFELGAPRRSHRAGRADASDDAADETMRQMNGRLIRTCRSKGPRLLEGASDA